VYDTGVAGAVLLPATGVSVAVVQVTRGFINQSEAFVESYKGKVWDQVGVIQFCTDTPVNDSNSCWIRSRAADA
jgi:hypothetical protein